MSNFDAWVPQAYLSEYYRELQEDERHVIAFFVERLREAPRGRALSFGCGPTLHHAFPLEPRATSVTLADYLPGNLEEIARWQRAEPDAHDWTPFVRFALEREGSVDAEGAVAARMTALRSKIDVLTHADASQPEPLGAGFREQFAMVISAYCAEAATSDKQAWAQYCRNIATLVAPGGMFLTAAVRLCPRYRSGDQFFPSASVDEHDLREVLLRDFRAESVEVRVQEVHEHAAQGFSGILLGCARK